MVAKNVSKQVLFAAPVHHVIKGSLEVLNVPNADMTKEPQLTPSCVLGIHVTGTEGEDEGVTEALIDCGAEGNLIDFNYCTANEVEMFNLRKIRSLTAIDGKSDASSCIKKFAIYNLFIGGKNCLVRAFVTWLPANDPIVLGMPFFEGYLPETLEAIRQLGDSSPTTVPDVSSHLQSFLTEIT